MQEKIADVVLTYENLNVLQIQDLEDALTLEQIVDFCKANPNDPDCKPTLPKCNYDGVDYAFGAGIKIKCPRYNDNGTFYCYQSWVFSGFDNPDNLDYSSIDAKADCKPPVISVIQSSNGAGGASQGGNHNLYETKSDQPKQTLKQYKLQNLMLKNSK